MNRQCIVKTYKWYFRNFGLCRRSASSSSLLKHQSSHQFKETSKIRTEYLSTYRNERFSSFSFLKRYDSMTAAISSFISKWYIKYQDMVGITDVKFAQERVNRLTEELLNAQSKRCELQNQLEVVQEQLIDAHLKISKSELYSEEHFALFEKARELSNNIKTIKPEFTAFERKERDAFTHLSAAIRDCHERERMQGEHSKYWSVLISVISAALASVITSVNNWVRIKEIKDHSSGLNEKLEDTQNTLFSCLEAEIKNSTDSLKKLLSEAHAVMPVVVNSSESEVLKMESVGSYRSSFVIAAGVGVGTAVAVIGILLLAGRSM